MTEQHKDVDRALDEAAHWVDRIPEVVAVGQGESGGEPTIDVWVAAAPGTLDLPERLHGVLVRVRDAGGPITAYPAEDRPS